jgi:hypothetical protein
MEKIISIPTLLWDKGTLNDGGRRLWLTTNELTDDDQKSLIMKYGDNKTFGYFTFKETPIAQEDIVDLPDIKPEFKSDKTPSQRLRAAIFVYWKNKGEKGEFDDFYKKQMNRIINRIKESLD